MNRRNYTDQQCNFSDISPINIKYIHTAHIQYRRRQQNKHADKHLDKYMDKKN